MNYLVAKVQFASFFSYRVPNFSSQYALSSLLPAPLTVKLALVSTAIQDKGKDFGKKIFEAIKNSQIGFKINGRVISNNFLIKRLKAKKAEGNKKAGEAEETEENEETKKEKRNDEGLQQTFGIRGYIFFEYPLEICIENTAEELQEIFTKVRYLGTSDSLCTIEVVESKAVSNNLVFAKKDFDQSLKNSLIIPTIDLSEKDTFEKIDIYSRERPKLEKKFYQIPVKKVEQCSSWTIYEIES